MPLNPLTLSYPNPKPTSPFHSTLTHLYPNLIHAHIFVLFHHSSFYFFTLSLILTYLRMLQVN
jgi:hypothetical protein